MRSKTKKASLALLATACIASVTCAAALGSGIRQSVSAEGGVKAEYVRVDENTGSAWEGNYGSKGYVVIGSESDSKSESLFYSSLYEGNDGKTIMQRKSWGYNNAGSVDGTLKESSPISDWSLSATVWTANSSNASNYKLYRPGTTEKMQYTRAHNSWKGLQKFDGTIENFDNGGWCEDTSVLFTLSENKPIYVTAAVIDWSNKVSSATPITVSVYNSKKQKPNASLKDLSDYEASIKEGVVSVVSNADGSTLTAEKYMELYYGEALATTTISKQTSYVSFELEGEGDYQIVAYYENPNFDQSPVTPMIHGFFFDEKLPLLTRNAEFVGSTNDYGCDWESSPYGSKGYVVVGSDESVTGNDAAEGTNNRKSLFYSSLYEGNDGKTIMVRESWSYNNVGSVSGTLKDSSPISDWGLSAVTWDTAEAGAKDYRLYRPGTTDKMYRSRLVNGWNIINGTSCGGQGWLKDTSVYFTVKDDNPQYVTTAIIDTNNKIAADKPITVAVYKLDKSGNEWMQPAHHRNGCILSISGDSTTGTMNSFTVNGEAATAENYMKAYYGEALATTTITQQDSYVTFKLEGKGDYRIVAYYAHDDYVNSVVTPMIHGFFFDSVNPTQPSFTEASLSLDGTIGLNFYANIPSAVAEDVKVKFSYGEHSEEANGIKQADGSYKFTLRLAAKDYATDVIAQLCVDGTQYDEKTYSVKAYCDYVAEHSSDESLKALCASIVSLGERANAYFSGSELGESVELTADKISASRASASGETSLLRGFALELESGTNLRVYVDESVQTAVVNEQSLERKVDDNGNVYFDLNDIAAKSLKNIYEISFSTAGEEGEAKSVRLRVSACSYAYVVLADATESNALKLVAEAIYNYGEAADAYFNAQA